MRAGKEVTINWVRKLIYPLKPQVRLTDEIATLHLPLWTLCILESESRLTYSTFFFVSGSWDRPAVGLSKLLTHSFELKKFNC